MAAMIPVDILNLIMDELRDDKPALRACALVCRAFLPHTRRYLFSVVELDHPTKSRNLYFVLADDPRLASYIRELCITSNTKPEFRMRDWVTIENTLPALLQMLDDLRSLTIQNVDQMPLSWVKLSQELRSSILDLLGSSTLLTNLSLIHLSNLPTSDMSRFEHLKQLRVVDIFDDTVPSSPTFRLQSPPRHRTPRNGHLRILEVHGSAKAAKRLLHALAQPSSLLDLSQLQELILQGNTDIVGPALAASAASLQCFIWGQLGKAHEGPFMPGPDNFENMHTLHTLVIETIFNRGYPYDPLPWLVSALGSGPPLSPLERLTIVIDFLYWRFSVTSREVEFLCDYEVWPALDAALTLPAYTKLRLVKIILKIGGGSSQLITDALFSLKMPRLTSAGVLVVEQADHTSIHSP